MGDGAENPDAAWIYPDPKPAASKIAGYVAFWKGVEVAALGRKKFLNLEKYERVARLYDFLDLPFEYGRYRRFRHLIFEGLSGRVLDAGVGTGRNIPSYPRHCQVVGIDISPAMLVRARRRRTKLGAKVELLEMDVAETTFPDRHFDAIVATFLFCVLEENDQLPALKELACICKSNGQIRLLEYTYPEQSLRRFIMRLWAPWVRWAYGAAFDRHSERYLPRAGLEIIEKRFLFRDVITLIIARPLSTQPSAAPPRGDDKK